MNAGAGGSANAALPGGTSSNPAPTLPSKESAAARPAGPDTPRRTDETVKTWSLDDHPRLKEELENLRMPERPWTIEELRAHLLEWRRRSPGTVEERLRHLERLATHPLVPVKIHGTRIEIVASFYAFVRHRELVEGKRSTAIVNDYKAIRALGDFLRIPANVWPTRPTVERRAKELLKSPEDVHELLHAAYTRNARKSYENHLVRHMLGATVGLNMRAPSELWEMRLGDFEPTTHTLVIREPKKGHRTRRLLIEPTWLCCGPTRLSLGTYLRRWRPKVDVGGTDRFWLRPTGEPFATKLDLARFLERRVQRHFPWFSCYFGRRWGSNARLIDSKYDYARVANFLGHESMDRLRNDYEQDARLHERLHGRSWIQRAFEKSHRRPVQRMPSTCSHPNIGVETGSSGVIPPVSVDGPRRTRGRQQERNRPKCRRGGRSSVLSHFPPLSPPSRSRAAGRPLLSSTRTR